jgi:hypothetical protein
MSDGRAGTLPLAALPRHGDGAARPFRSRSALSSPRGIFAA